MNVHLLKTVDPYYLDLRSGRKNFELRKNERNYQVNDLLLLNRFDPVTGQYEPDEYVAKRVGYVLENFEGIELGYCILGLTMPIIPLSEELDLYEAEMKKLGTAITPRYRVKP